jgi:hypothetical protein
MNDEQFDALCEANRFGAVARGDFQLVPRALLKVLVDAAVAAEREACAKVCEMTYEGAFEGARPCFETPDQCAAAIRARSQA